MSNLFEALKHAQHQRGMSTPPAVPGGDMEGHRPAVTMEQELLELHHALAPLLDGRRAIQFIGSTPGSGVSTIVRQYARLAAMRLRTEVLIVDADGRGQGQRAFFGITTPHGWDEAVAAPETLERALCRVGNTGVQVSCLSIDHVAVSTTLDPARTGALLERLKERFELILVDTPPLSVTADGLTLVRCVDGVVQVVEADRTRGPVAESTKNAILKNGGRLLGVVFNKRRYHIPPFVYKCL